jgi:predicted DNA-binding transcriptional regulator AlpA
MTDIKELIQSGASIKIEITAEDLKNFGNEIATKSLEAIQNQASQESDSQYLTGQKVCEILSISRVTLWQWDKKEITKPIRFGNLKRYRRSDIDAMGQE